MVVADFSIKIIDKTSPAIGADSPANIPRDRIETLVCAGVYQRHSEVRIQDIHFAGKGDVKVNLNFIGSRRKINRFAEQLEHPMPRKIPDIEIVPVVHNIDGSRACGKTVSSSGHTTDTFLQPRS